MTVRVHYGCGDHAGAGWLNFDVSPMLRVERLPGGSALKKFVGGGRPFPKSVRAGNIVDGPLVEESTATSAYASHVLEHLSLEEARVAIRNTYHMLAPGGVFRLIVPDLEWRAEMYLADMRKGDANAASEFMRQCILGREHRYRGPIHWLRKQLSGSSHLWMWDFVSMKAELESAGFTNIRRCSYGDAADPGFAEVENPNRFVGSIDDTTSMPELAMEAIRPGRIS